MTKTPTTQSEVMFEGTLDAAPEKVWRALTIPEFLTAWLLPANRNGEASLVLDGKAHGLAGEIGCTVIEARAPDLLRYRWQEAGQPESVVTFELTRTDEGRTWLRLSQGALRAPTMLAANGNAQMRLAA
ncbi:MAG TPA: SRPBCC domain-containing protein [Devosiaceae bacterium]|jgi:uncharacterized protein YndB with AHSA1/START domain